MKTILLVDDHVMIRNAIKQFLDGITEYKVTREAENGKDAFDKLLKESFDLVITDVHMPVANGLELMENIRLNFPHQKVLALTMDNEPGMIRKLYSLSINGYVLKNVNQKEFIFALDQIFSESKYFSSEAQDKLNEFHKKQSNKDAFLPELTEGELKTLQLIVRNIPDSQIIKELSLEPTGFNQLLDNLYQKSNCSSKQGLILFAIEKGLI